MNNNIPRRSMKSGSWYWVSKVIIQEYSSRIGFSALSVYHFLASMVDEQQVCYPSQKYIAEHLGCSRATVSKAIKKLKQQRLVNVTKKNRWNCIYQLSDVRCNRSETKVSTERNSSVQKLDTNKNHITRINNNSGKGIKKSYKKIEFKTFTPTTREELLALDIAESLSDQERLSLYLSYAYTYTESFLREILAEVSQTPSKNIKKSRGALFLFLVKKNAKTTS